MNAQEPSASVTDGGRGLLGTTSHGVTSRSVIT